MVCRSFVAIDFLSERGILTRCFYSCLESCADSKELSRHSRRVRSESLSSRTCEL